MNEFQVGERVYYKHTPHILGTIVNKTKDIDCFVYDISYDNGAKITGTYEKRLKAKSVEPGDFVKATGHYKLEGTVVGIIEDSRPKEHWTVQVRNADCQDRYMPYGQLRTFDKHFQLTNKPFKLYESHAVDFPLVDYDSGTVTIQVDKHKLKKYGVAGVLATFLMEYIDED